MRKKISKENQGDVSDRRYPDVNQEDEGSEDMKKVEKKQVDEYKCGKEACGKLYHSYTAFYNHCKKSHEGIFPPNSLYNYKPFEGPSKNRGRPRIKKTDVKDSIQIQSLKTENELIQFLGTLPKKKKIQQLIVYVPNPIQQLNMAIEAMIGFGRQGIKEQLKQFISSLIAFNKYISDHDLPDFYDPIEISKYLDKMDSYNFLSIYNFLLHPQKKTNSLYSNQQDLMRKTLITWLTRILSVPLLAEVIYTVGQMSIGIERIDQKQYMAGKSSRFRQLVEKYFQCTLNQQNQNINTNMKLQPKQDNEQ